MKYSDLQIVTRSIRCLILLTFIVLSTSCKKEPEDPAPIPNAFDDMSATINGQAWKASCTPSWPGLGCSKVHCQYYDDDNGFEIIAKNDINVIRFHKSGGQGGVVTGQNILPHQSSNLITSVHNCLSNEYIEYKLDTTFINILEIIQIDKTNKLIEGRFNLRVINKQCTDTILINDGYFKTKYWP